jgi:hypothetical protein
MAAWLVWAAGLRDNAGDLNLAQCDDLRWQQFVRHNNERSPQRIHVGLRDFGQMRAQPKHNVAHIIQSLAKVFILGAGKQIRVFVQQPMQCRLRGQAVASDPQANLLSKGRITQNGLVHPEDGRLLMSNLRLHLALQRMEVLGGVVASRLVLGQLSSGFMVLQSLRVRVHKDLVDAIRNANRHAWRDRNTFSHARQCSKLRGSRQFGTARRWQHSPTGCG